MPVVRGPIFGGATHPHARHPPRGGTQPGRRDRFQKKIVDGLLPQIEAGSLLDDPLHLHLVEPLVGLGPGAVHRRALGAVEHAKLDAGRVDRLAHDAPERVDLADELRLADATDRRVATHLAHGVEIGREQGDPAPEPGRGAGRLHAGMAGADNDHVIVVATRHGHDCTTA